MTSAYVTRTSTGAATSIPTCLYSVNLCSDSDPASVIVTDGNGGDTVCKLYSPAQKTSISITFPEPIHCQNGVYLTLTGTAPTCSISYT